MKFILNIIGFDWGICHLTNHSGRKNSTHWTDPSHMFTPQAQLIRKAWSIRVRERVWFPRSQSSVSRKMNEFWMTKTDVYNMPLNIKWMNDVWNRTKFETELECSVISHYLRLVIVLGGSQGKNTGVVCHSLLQRTTFCQTFPPWHAHLGLPHRA